MKVNVSFNWRSSWSGSEDRSYEAWLQLSLPKCWHPHTARAFPLVATIQPVRLWMTPWVPSMSPSILFAALSFTQLPLGLRRFLWYPYTLHKLRVLLLFLLPVNYCAHSSQWNRLSSTARLTPLWWDHFCRGLRKSTAQITTKQRSHCPFLAQLCTVQHRGACSTAATPGCCHNSNNK